MLRNELSGLPSPPTPAIQVLEGQQVAVDFAQEVQYRQAFDDYCAWYDQAAQAHRRSLTHMRRELNLLAWFSRAKS